MKASLDFCTSLTGDTAVEHVLSNHAQVFSNPPPHILVGSSKDANEVMLA